MQYLNHYNTLIERAKNRTLRGYKERHHIIPRCMGGMNDKDNLIDLTAEEHFIAHLLLVKIYPKNRRLVLAASMMTCSNTNQNRSGNKLYGWLRRKLAKVMSQSQKGEGNSQYDTCWVTNIELQKSIKISKDHLESYLDNGWIRKRIIDFDKYGRWDGKCIICNKILEGRSTIRSAIYCSKECKKQGRKSVKRKSRFRDELENLCYDYQNTKSVKATLLRFGFCGTGKQAVFLMNELRKQNMAA